MTSDEKLVVVILVDSMEKANDILLKIAEAEWEYGNVKFNRPHGILIDNNVIYKAIEPDKCTGMLADQVIMDKYNTSNLHFATELLNRSCVPDKYQIINIMDLEED